VQSNNERYTYNSKGMILYLPASTLILAVTLVSVRAFAPSSSRVHCKHLSTHQQQHQHKQQKQHSCYFSNDLQRSNRKGSSSSTSPTQLNFGVIVAVPDDFFTITGISLGFAYTILRSWNRVTVENVAWENRLEDARLAKLDDDDDLDPNSYTELDLRRMDAAASKSAYGPDAMDGRERKRRASRVQTLEDEEYFEEEEEGSDRVNSMTDEEINDFEETYGVEYDAYYDEPYTVDELPDDMSFVEDKVYGDRRYENGEIFYRGEGDTNIYWRQGGRPRLKQLWELL